MASQNKTFITTLIYMQSKIECWVITLVDMPLVTVEAGKGLSTPVVLHWFVRDLVTWYQGLHTWYPGSMTQCDRNHSLLTRLVYNYNYSWCINKFFLPAYLALLQSGLHGKMLWWFMIWDDHSYLSLDVESLMVAGLYNCKKLSVVCCVISLYFH